jgi:hypothetical protein
MRKRKRERRKENEKDEISDCTSPRLERLPREISKACNDKRVSRGVKPSSAY